MRKFSNPLIIGDNEFARGYVLESNNYSSVALIKYSGRKNFISCDLIAEYDKNKVFELQMSGDLVKRIRQDTKGKPFVVRESLKHYFS